MAQPSIWFYNNDMLATLTGLRSSTMSSTAYLNSSTGVTVSVWKALSTAVVANRVVNAANLAYLAGTNGNYRAVVQSTQHGMTIGSPGLAIYKVAHSGLDGEWRLIFKVEPRLTT